MRYLSRLVTTVFISEAVAAARWVAMVLLVLCAGCGVGGLPVGISGAQLFDPLKATVLCVKGSGPIPSAWTALYLGTSVPPGSGALSVTADCGITFTPGGQR